MFSCGFKHKSNKPICVSFAFYATLFPVRRPPRREDGVTSYPSARLQDFLSSLSFRLLPPSFFWAAQSRMRVILPMSPLQCRNPAFWQHPDLLTSPLHRADRIFLCNAFDWPRSRHRKKKKKKKKTRLNSVSGLPEAALGAVFVCCCNYLCCVF